MKTYRTLLVLSAVFAMHLMAEPITFTVSATGSGTIGSVPFTNALVTFTQTTDNTMVGTQFCGATIPCALQSTSNMVTVAGVGTFGLPFNSFFFNASAQGVVGINRSGSADLLDISNPALVGFDMLSNLGPLSGPITNGSAITNLPTSGGNLTVQFGATGAFQAAVGPAGQPDLTITGADSGNFLVGGCSAYSPRHSQPGSAVPSKCVSSISIWVSNIGSAASSGPVTVADTLSPGVPSAATIVNVTGSGWTCATPTSNIASCTRSDALPAGQNYPAITITVLMEDFASSALNNVAVVSGGGDGNAANNTYFDNRVTLPSQNPAGMSQVAVNTVPERLRIMVDGVVWKAPHNFVWPVGSMHTVVSVDTLTAPYTIGNFVFGPAEIGAIFPSNIIVTATQYESVTELYTNTGGSPLQ